MIEIIPGIYQLQIPMPNNPLEHTNVYLVRGSDGYLLIDAGWNNDRAFKSLKEQLAEIGIAPGAISDIVVTHSHADHYGLTGKLKEHTGAKIALHHLEEKLLASRNGDMRKMMLQTQDWFHSNGVPDETFPSHRISPSERRRFNNHTMPDIALRGDETISTGIFDLQVIWTPGHSPGHICLYEKDKKILFTGDHVLPGITPNISLQPQSEDNPLGDFLNALGKVRKLDVNTVLPAHEHIFTDLPGRINQITHHHGRRIMEITGAMKSGPKTAYQISAEITWMPDFGGVRFMDLNPWVRRMAVSETLAHLKAMEVDGIVDRFSDDEIVYYRHNS
jgi:glyoxylase-like metal-dependent hydrolase (beta-lactamase superfamily II)